MSEADRETSIVLDALKTTFFLVLGILTVRQVIGLSSIPPAVVIAFALPIAYMNLLFEVHSQRGQWQPAPVSAAQRALAYAVMVAWQVLMLFLVLATVPAEGERSLLVGLGGFVGFLLVTGVLPDLAFTGGRTGPLLLRTLAGLARRRHSRQVEGEGRGTQGVQEQESRS